MVSLTITLLAIFSILLTILSTKKGYLIFVLIIPYLDLLPRTSFLGVNLQNLLIFTLFLASVLARRRSRTKDPTAAIVALFVAWISISAVLTPAFTEMRYLNGGPSAGVLTSYNNWVPFMLLYFVSRNTITTNRDVHRLSAAISFGLFMEAALCLAQSIHRGGARRLYGHISTNPNDFAAFLTAYVFLCVALAACKRQDRRDTFLYLGIDVRLPRFFYIVASVTAIVDIVLSGSRGAYLAILLVSLYFSLRRSILLSTVLITFLITVSLNYQSILPPVAVKRINQTFVSSEELGVELGGVLVDRSAGARLLLSKVSYRIWMDSPLWGVGFHRMPSYGWAKGYFQSEGLDRPMVAHNAYLQILAEFGIIGLALYILLNIRVWTSATEVIKNSRDGSFERYYSLALKCIILSFAVTNLFGSRFYNGRVIAYFFVSCGAIPTLMTYLHSLSEPGRFRLNESACD